MTTIEQNLDTTTTESKWNLLREHFQRDIQEELAIHSVVQAIQKAYKNGSLPKPSTHTVETDFLLAASKNDVATIEKLLKQGVNINAKGLFGETALHVAAVLGHTETVKCLLNHNADLKIVAYKLSYQNGYTAFELALEENQAKIAQLMVDHKVLKNYTNDQLSNLVLDKLIDFLDVSEHFNPATDKIKAEAIADIFLMLTKPMGSMLPEHLNWQGQNDTDTPLSIYFDFIASVTDNPFLNALAIKTSQALEMPRW